MEHPLSVPLEFVHFPLSSGSVAHAFLRATFAVVRTYGVPKNGYVARRTASTTTRRHAALLEQDSILLKAGWEAGHRPGDPPNSLGIRSEKKQKCRRQDRLRYSLVAVKVPFPNSPYSTVPDIFLSPSIVPV